MTRWLGYIAMSMDARIADAGGGMEWLEAFGGDDTDFGYKDFYDSIDALVMGRATHDFIVAESKWPYGGKPSYVVSARPLDTGRDDIVGATPDFGALKARIEQAGHARVWVVGGGMTQRAALDAGMLDELRLFVMPILLGGGPLVFADGALARANMTGHRAWPKGVMELNYSF